MHIECLKKKNYIFRRASGIRLLHAETRFVLLYSRNSFLFLYIFTYNMSNKLFMSERVFATAKIPLYLSTV